jgi:hypothetical protein
MVVLIAIMVSVFFSYVDDTEREFERASIIQTKKIIDSSLAVIFATYAVNHRLDDLNELDGGNPFVFLEEYRLLPPGYRGELDTDLATGLAPGWYYLKHRGLVAYKSFFINTDSYFELVLDYEDVNLTGRFERKFDRFRNLYFAETTKN